MAQTMPPQESKRKGKSRFIPLLATKLVAAYAYSTRAAGQFGTFTPNTEPVFVQRVSGGLRLSAETRSAPNPPFNFCRFARAKPGSLHYTNSRIRSAARITLEATKPSAG